MLIAGLVMLAGALATPLIQNYYQSKENEKNREEAITLANIKRADVLKQQKIDNTLSLRKLNNLSNQNSFNNKMTLENIKDQNQQQSYLFNKTNQSFIQAGASKFTGNPTQYDVIRSSIVNRGY